MADLTTGSKCEIIISLITSGFTFHTTLFKIDHANFTINLHLIHPDSTTTIRAVNSVADFLRDARLNGCAQQPSILLLLNFPC